MLTKGDHRSNLIKMRLILELQLKRFSEGKIKKLPLDGRGEFEPLRYDSSLHGVDFEK